MRNKTCNICGFGKLPILAIKPKLLPFAMGTEKDLAKEGAKGMVIDEVQSVSRDVPSEAVEWVGDSRARPAMFATISACFGMLE